MDAFLVNPSLIFIYKQICFRPFFRTKFWVFSEPRFFLQQDSIKRQWCENIFSFAFAISYNWFKLAFSTFTFSKELARKNKQSHLPNTTMSVKQLLLELSSYKLTGFCFTKQLEYSHYIMHNITCKIPVSISERIS